MLAEGILLVLADVNVQPGAVAKDASGLMVAAISIDIVSDRVHALRAVTNPDKLGHIPIG
jgi:RNA polymerase sigma-70 factor (ECF subfamily)